MCTRDPMIATKVHTSSILLDARTDGAAKVRTISEAPKSGQRGQYSSPIHAYKCNISWNLRACVSTRKCSAWSLSFTTAATERKRLFEYGRTDYSYYTNTKHSQQPPLCLLFTQHHHRQHCTGSPSQHLWCIPVWPPPLLPATTTTTTLPSLLQVTDYHCSHEEVLRSWAASHLVHQATPMLDCLNICKDNIREQSTRGIALYRLLRTSGKRSACVNGTNTMANGGSPPQSPICVDQTLVKLLRPASSAG